jgi:hypothetical protein
VNLKEDGCLRTSLKWLEDGQDIPKKVRGYLIENPAAHKNNP